MKRSAKNGRTAGLEPVADGSQKPNGGVRGCPAKAGIDTPQNGDNRDVSTGQSHGAEGSASPNGRGSNAAPACGASPAFNTKRRRTKPKPVAYPDGFFTSLMRAHNWPPGFVSRTTAKDGAPVDASRRSTAAREEAMRSGLWWGTGTLPLSNTPTRDSTDWIVRMKAAR